MNSLPPSVLPGTVVEAALNVWSQAGGQHAIPVTGQSMWPTLREGDRVWVALGWEGVGRGDLIVYRRGEGLVVHRVVAVQPKSEGGLFITQGDNRRHRDAPVAPSQVIGLVTAFERRGRIRQMPSGFRLWTGWGFARILSRLNALRSRFR